MYNLAEAFESIEMTWKYLRSASRFTYITHENAGMIHDSNGFLATNLFYLIQPRRYQKVIRFMTSQRHIYGHTMTTQAVDSSKKYSNIQLLAPRYRLGMLQY